MNTQIEKLFEKYKFSAKDKYEINQFFELLPNYKKINFIKNFDILAKKIKEIQKSIKVERNILIGEALIDIKQILDKLKQGDNINYNYNKNVGRIIQKSG